MEPLGKKHAIHLARNYFKKRGINDIKQSDLEKIAESSNNNPLAIRLTIDLYLTGKDIPESIVKSQKDITSFSYRNLIDALSENSIDVLETIFSQHSSSRTELVELLEKSNEEIAEAVNELSKTSLIYRSIGVDKIDTYSLSDSIRDLLLINPRNMIIRKKVSESLRKRKSLIQEQFARQRQLGVTEFDETFIEPNTADTIKLIVADTNKLLGKKKKPSYSDLSTLQQKYNDLMHQCTNSYLFYYNYARLAHILNDSHGEISYLLDAEKLNINSPRVKIAIAKYYFRNSTYDKAEEYFSDLISKGFTSTKISTKLFAFEIIKGYLQSLLLQGHSQKVIDRTEDWKSLPEHKELYGAYRAAAFKSEVELKINTDIPMTCKYLSNSFTVLNDIFDTEGYASVACIEAFKLIKEINYIILGKNNYPVDFLMKSMTFVANHLFHILQNIRFTSLDSPQVSTYLKNFYDLNIKNNPIQTITWYQPKVQFKYAEEDIAELEGNGFTIITVYSIPNSENGVGSFMFGKDNLNQEYYLNVDNFTSGGWEEWAYFEVGKKLAIKFKNENKNGKTIPATEIVEIEIEDE
ncbi:MAG: hypothetical protein GQ474_05775 [Sulfurimonas sp.]|nr:hypothetical protein [Sulfurimonas sp.]